MAPRMRVRIPPVRRVVFEGAREEAKREASKGRQETEEEGGRKGGGGGRSRGEERGRGSGLCKCAHVQIWRVECAKVVGR